ncbi:hypothetical protein BGZ96_002909 [Linnemannia gamsii]|uniref:ABC transporter domain-containing protein n=1 Tax=Linnemannia gamsii TaxID=64522 RepID=A0ABQ7JK39_9FUNG|nr:hypothetical protein BGZ96_002909 [Linnemannia gamsii]
MRFHFSVAAVLAVASLISAQSTMSQPTITATVTATVTAPGAPASTPPTCQPAFDCSKSPCLNSGVCSLNNQCKCLPGFGGLDCGLMSCGSPLQQISQRPTVNAGSSCTTCDSGYGGFNCNVCETDDACAADTSRPSMFGDEKMVCNKKPELFYNAFMTCDVNTPQLAGLFPGNYALSLDLDVKNSSIKAQLWMDNSEQFFCSIDACIISTTELEGQTKTTWECPSLKCTCITTPTKLCGGIPTPAKIDLKNTIRDLTGPFSLDCPHGSTTCAFRISQLDGLLPNGLEMVNCKLGECVYPTEMSSSITSLKKTMPAGVIICLGVLGALVIFLIVVCSIAKRNQIVLSRTPYTLNNEAASLEFRNVGYTLNKDGLEILKGISGSAPAGVVLAVMGPSGAGKSTLVDILAGKRKDGKVSGHILLNGKQVHESEIRRAVGFVDQEDTLPATQTVWEAVLFSAMLRLPEAMPIYRVHERVAEVIEMLGLTHCKDRQIGNVTARGISGGEKRRVSIALELITRPPILILDEPTSGLDSYSAHMVVQQLCKLAASKTTTVIMTIHQPRSDIFYMFDQTLVVSKGACLYFGPTDTAADYFQRRGLICPPNYNIADYLLDIAMDQELVTKAKSYNDAEAEKADGLTSGHQAHLGGGNVVSRRGGAGTNGNTSEITRTSDEHSYETSVRMEEIGSTGSSTASLSESTSQKKQKTVYPTSFLTQLRVIMLRSFQTLVRNKSLLVLHFAVAIVLGVFVGGLYFDVPMDLAGFQNRAGSLFFMLALLGFSSISALGAFTDTRTLFVKERSNGYYPPMPFIISTLLFDLIPLRIVPAILMGSVSYFMIGLTADVETFFKFLLILVLFNVATAMFCLVIAAGVRTTGVASLASSIVMLFMMLFGGFLINSKQIPKALTWIQYLSMFKYGFEALAVNEVAKTQLIDNIQGVAFNVPGSLILQKLFGFDLTGFWKNMIFLIGYNVLFIAAFWAIVSLRLKERK